jgi:hypothetical protein
MTRNYLCLWVADGLDDDTGGAMAVKQETEENIFPD